MTSPPTQTLVFDPVIDRGAWPAVTAAAGAAVGMATVGPFGLVASLETPLGLTGLVPTASERLAAMLTSARQLDGFWSRSLSADPLGTAQSLLRMRDALVMEGWRGEPASARLRQLAEVAAAIPPGLPDRARAVADALGERARLGRSLDTGVHFVSPTADLPGTLTTIRRHLSAMGALLPAPALFPGANEAASGTTGLSRQRVQLVRSFGPLSAASDVAAWLAQRPLPHSTVVIGPDSLLDDALARHGLPTAGSSSRRAATPLLQVTDLILQLAWQPCDPSAAQQLLLLPASPVPSRLARYLARALTQWPAVGSVPWQSAVDTALAELDSPDARATLAHRLDVIFGPRTPHGQTCAAMDLAARTQVIREWVGDSAPTDQTGSAWNQLAVQLRGFDLLLGALGRANVSQADCRRLVRAATEGVETPRRFLAEAGIHPVSDPGAVLGPAPAVVWWNFTRASEPGVHGPPVTPSERRQLATLGLDLVDSSTHATARVQRYRRPWLCHQGTLLLVCPLRDERGDEAHPHPLWDELTAGLSAAESDALTSARPTLGWAATSTTRQPVPAPMPTRRWSVPAISPRQVESPTSLANLLGCSFRWAVEHVGGARNGLAAPLPGASLLVGRVAHELLERLLAELPVSGHGVAAERAAALFDSAAPHLAAGLFLPGSDSARAEARRLVVESARDLYTILHFSNLNVIASEQKLEGPLNGQQISGRADLIVGGTPTTPGRLGPGNDSDNRAVIDLKTGSGNWRRRELEAGTSLQLAAYAHLLAGGRTPPPPGAYFIMSERRLLSLDRGFFIGGEAVVGPDLATTWQHVVQSVHRRLGELSAGLLEANGNPDAAGRVWPEESALRPDGGLDLEPPCRYCDHSGLCGRRFGALDE